MECKNCEILESKVINLENAIRNASRYMHGSFEDREYRRKYYELLAQPKSFFQYLQSFMKK